MRNLTTLPKLLLILATVAGCSHPELNPKPPTSESEVLSDAVELTHGFLKAGEAYFSPDMKWIVFQATVKPDEDFQMYVAQLKWDNGAITGTHPPVRISPQPSWNSCGHFSPDGESLIFASTALKPKMVDAKGGFQREKGSYRWATPPGAEIFRADGWKGAVTAAPAGGHVDLAKHPLTDNAAYDAECSYSPDGKWIVYASKLEEPAAVPAPTSPNEPTGGSLLRDANKPATTQAAPASPNLELFAMRADGSKRVRLTTAAGYDGGPFFSPDGKRVCYRSDRKGNNLLQVYVADLVFDAAGDIVGLRNEKQLTTETSPNAGGDKPQPAINWTPYWHPDNRHLVWASSAHGHSNYEVYLMRDDGSRKTRVTFTAGFDGLPVFSRDGKWLMWTSGRGPEKTSQIWVARFRMPGGS